MANDNLTDHEYDGIREFDNPTPGWWHLIFWLTIAFSFSYFVYYQLGPSGRTLDASYQAAVAENLRLRFSEIGELMPDESTLLQYMGKPEWLAVGQSTYVANCKSCHAEDGSGQVGPNLTDDHYKNVKSLTDLVAVILNGAAGQNMPAWRSRLHPNEIVLVSAYVANFRGKNLPGPRGQEGQIIPAWPTAAAGSSDGADKKDAGGSGTAPAPAEKGAASSSAELPALEDRVLSTLHADGSRRWLSPRLSRGRFLRARRILAYVLIAVFTLVPYLTIQGKPAVLLNLPKREFTILGFTFLPTDTALLALFLVTLIVGIFLATALLGRVWCGWMCPQTVYLEFVYRPLERLFDGPPGARHTAGRKSTPWRKLAKYGVFLLISMYLAHTFLAYFVGVEALSQWVRRSPWNHPVSFLVMLAVTGLMLFDFSYFREQTCIVACPYGRFQSVMLDRDSLIVSYDRSRGEPRGRRVKDAGPEPKGDCIDCGLCTDTCPTGIDIRDGLQMECVACTQCIDACDGVMDRIGKPRGLIRFSSQARMEGEPGRLVRPRVILYPLVLLALMSVFGVVLASKQPADVTLLRGMGFLQHTGVRRSHQSVAGEDQEPQRGGCRLPHRRRGDAWCACDHSGKSAARAGRRGANCHVAHCAAPRGLYRRAMRVQIRVSDGNRFTTQRIYRLLGPRD